MLQVIIIARFKIVLPCVRNVQPIALKIYLWFVLVYQTRGRGERVEQTDLQKSFHSSPARGEEDSSTLYSFFPAAVGRQVM